MQKLSQFVGLDVHKDTIVMAVAPGGPGMEVKDMGSMAHDVPTLLRRLKPLGEPGQVHIAYEAGPTGFGLWRALRAAGYSCVVVAPSKTPK
ncbi:MAG: IS110 family transposase, partial [Planctomycetaceae bacterium]|nr:IS110 family transposase [Planctomycetaceae bacterium]